MAHFRIVGPALMLGVVLIARLIYMSAGHGSAYTGPVPHYHSVPCPNVTPDRVATTWQIAHADGERHARSDRAVWHIDAGRRIVRDRSVVVFLYRQVCSTVLIKYDHLGVAACPAGAGSARYHPTFSVRSRVLLQVTETNLGCQFLWIDGHRGLGYGFGVL